jgi:hypothetical protein
MQLNLLLLFSQSYLQTQSTEVKNLMRDLELNILKLLKIDVM